MRILAIETSCDETAVAIVSDCDGGFLVEESVVASQIAMHAKYGGVVPEVAARLHVPVLPKMIEAVTGWKRGNIDAVAVTAGPGLATSLRVGIETAKALAVSWNVPLVPVDHIEGHIFSSVLDQPFDVSSAQSILAVIVSGGHTELVWMEVPGAYEIIGHTKDDAAGEAFDKVAAVLGLGYPGGPAVSREAKQGRRDAFDFPRPMMNSGDFSFSFSGLKTAVKNLVEKTPMEYRTDQFVSDVCASFEEAVVEVLVTKARRAAEERGAEVVWLGGGVAANARLRERLVSSFADTTVKVRLPEMKYTGDHAAMIGAAGLVRLLHDHENIDRFTVDADPSHRVGSTWKWEKEI